MSTIPSRLKLLLAALALSPAALAHPPETDDFGLKVQVLRKGDELHTAAVFHVPLDKCQAYHFLVDYDASAQIPGVISSKLTRLADNKVRVELKLEERILHFPVRLLSVLEITELPSYGTDFVQVKGEIPSFKGSWRLSEGENGTNYRYQAVAKPDSVLPMFVIRYFIEHSLTERFAALAKLATERRGRSARQCGQSGNSA
ncbi:hypothetical protein [Niveibacterium terrae]|uniref:hypothetical protein n=1 Tax=Niveibacterium terrae TaxID=3373598 RepID=UPI003A954440